MSFSEIMNNMATYQELVAQKAALEQQAAALAQQIEDARRAERASAIAKVKALMAEHGVTLAELGGAKGAAAPRPVRAVKEKREKASSPRKVPAKYRNAATGDAWSGRGLKPNWLKAALASGSKLEDFAV